MAEVEEVAVYVLLKDFDGFLSHIEVLHPFGVYFCVWCTETVQFHFFACGCPIFPTPFVEETVFFPLDVDVFL